MKFVNPKNDIAFKKIFGNEQHKEILISFLNAVLGLTGEREIAEVTLLNPYEAPKINLLKGTLLDVKAVDKQGVTFIVEMQVENVVGLRKRFQYYVAKAYSSQIERGHDYPKLNQVIFIGILNFSEFEGEDYLTRHALLNCKTYKQELQDMELNFIELPKFGKQEDELETTLEKWIYFIKYAPDLQMIPPHANIPPLQTAYEVANSFGWSKEEMEIYDYRGIKMQDEQGALDYAYQQGTEQGMQQGVQKKALEMAQKMLAKGYDWAEVAELSGLPVDVLAQIGR